MESLPTFSYIVIRRAHHIYRSLARRDYYLLAKPHVISGAQISYIFFMFVNLRLKMGYVLS